MGVVLDNLLSKYNLMHYRILLVTKSTEKEKTHRRGGIGGGGFVC